MRAGPDTGRAAAGSSMPELAYSGLRATRIFQDTPIPDAVLGELLEAATMACSSGNTQPWEFIVVTDQAVKDALKVEMVDAFSVIDGERASLRGWRPLPTVVLRGGSKEGAHLQI